ncbi:nicotinamidase-related amidase [Pullulanibacillus pueri]|uniref:Isochorismatase n=1 Tax=Pullulanibacillus pueri TaxID=1437324 RepID=A0A8J2ZTV2_9BACL|nr:isochorismatase family protein [Pullulanibacillus pueri]MBM7681249.1 nicotinamidase-related amidase [Pullulanibacillus pueri]GGH77883.1 isochorismatase [Pullulanibacillus pueri]
MKQALLVIDAQQELIEGTDQEPSVINTTLLIQNINTVIEKAMQWDSLIVFVRDQDVAGGKGEGFQIHQEIKVPEVAQIFDKKGTNAFFETPLLGYLKDHAIEHLVIMGCKTEHCIDSAVRTATINGFDVTLVHDGHSTTDTAILPAESIINHHNDILHGHDNIYHFSMVRKAREEVFQPIHNDYR